MFTHDGLDTQYRSPLGALPCQSSVTLSGHIEKRGLQPRLLLFDENGQVADLPMEEQGDKASVSFVLPEKPGLLFYRFKVGGRPYGGSLGRGQWGSDACWQITVYDGSFTTPAWFSQTVCYQIFPDRFCRSGQAPTQTGAAYHRSMGRSIRLHESWQEEVEYLPAAGEAYYGPLDYFGGDLKGIEEKLPYLQQLGIGCLYLNPIFEAHSNHRYNTADYERIDPLLGTNEDFVRLCREAGKVGISIILDGVFSHTGSDSRYFDRKGVYGGGAYTSKDSPYYPWYRFSRYPDAYESWWGFDTLPNVEELEPGYGDFIHGEGGVLAQWLQKGAMGWRLDVADELPDAFIEKLRKRIKQENPEAVLIGEVWEDASNKRGGEGLRSYTYGHSLDGVMDYPLGKGLLDYCGGFCTAYEAEERLWSLFIHYPRAFMSSCLQLLSSHDEIRALSYLCGRREKDVPREQQALYTPTSRELAAAKARFLCATALQMVLPGVPCIYYGDEAGLWGLSDPFNRRTYPWGQEDKALIEEVRALIKLRNSHSVLRNGHMRLAALTEEVLCVARYEGEECILLLVNAGREACRLALYPGLLYKGYDGDKPLFFAGSYRDSFSGQVCTARNSLSIAIPACGFRVLIKE